MTEIHFILLKIQFEITCTLNLNIQYSVATNTGFIIMTNRHNEYLIIDFGDEFKALVENFCTEYKYCINLGGSSKEFPASSCCLLMPN